MRHKKINTEKQKLEILPPIIECKEKSPLRNLSRF